jgi:hypothetical protein
VSTARAVFCAIQILFSGLAHSLQSDLTLTLFFWSPNDEQAATRATRGAGIQRLRPVRYVYRGRRDARTCEVRFSTNRGPRPRVDAGYPDRRTRQTDRRAPPTARITPKTVHPSGSEAEKAASLPVLFHTSRAGDGCQSEALKGLPAHTSTSPIRHLQHIAISTVNASRLVFTAGVENRKILVE